MNGISMETDDRDGNCLIISLPKLLHDEDQHNALSVNAA
jgi:hypothetical protein